MLEALQVDNKAISSSGDYQQYFINEEGVRRHHILNPFTGYSENTFRGITLIADSNGGLLDALSTSIYSLKEENVETLIQKMEAEYKLNIEKILIQDDENGNLKAEFAIEGMHMWANAYEQVFENLLPYLENA